MEKKTLNLKNLSQLIVDWSSETSLLWSETFMGSGGIGDEVEQRSWEIKASTNAQAHFRNHYGKEPYCYSQAHSRGLFIAWGLAPQLRQKRPTSQENQALVSSIGLDLEHSSRPLRKEVDQLKKRMFTEEASLQKKLSFLELWTLKEAALKAGSGGQKSGELLRDYQVQSFDARTGMAQIKGIQRGEDLKGLLLKDSGWLLAFVVLRSS